VRKDQLTLSVQRMVDLEIAVCGVFNRAARPRQIQRFFVGVSRWGDGGVWYAAMLALPFLFGEPGVSTSLQMVQVGLINLILYKTIKQIAGRARPCDIDPRISLGTAALDQYSFPSGHTMHAVAFSIVMTAHHAELTWFVVPLSSLIALSRLVLGLHFPTDVMAGALIGGYVASVWIAF
jgi:undecaprenyl-diphosphatase